LPRKDRRRRGECEPFPSGKKREKTFKLHLVQKSDPERRKGKRRGVPAFSHLLYILRGGKEGDELAASEGRRGQKPSTVKRKGRG